MVKVERRYTATPSRRVGVETRADGKRVIVGYAAVYHRAGDAGTEYELYPGVVERIKPGAFDLAIREDDVRALFNHDPNIPLGRNTAGTLRLSVDDTGLRYEIDPPTSAAGVVEAIERGDVTGSSFGFVPDVTTFREDGELTIIEREAVRLFDVSPVTFPAYTGATVGLRAAGDTDGARAEVEAWRAARVRRREIPDYILAGARVAELRLR